MPPKGLAPLGKSHVSPSPANTGGQQQQQQQQRTTSNANLVSRVGSNNSNNSNSNIFQHQLPSALASNSKTVRIADVRDAADLVDPVPDSRLLGIESVTEREAAKKTLRALHRLHAQEQTVLRSIESADPERAMGGVVCHAPATMRNVVRPTVVSKERPLAAHGASTPNTSNNNHNMRAGSSYATRNSPLPSLSGTLASQTARDGFVTSEREHELTANKARHDTAVTVTTRVPASLVPFTRLAEERKRLLAVGNASAAAALSLKNARGTPALGGSDDDHHQQQQQQIFNNNNGDEVSPARAGRLVPPGTESRGTTTQPMRAATPGTIGSANSTMPLPPRTPQNAMNRTLMSTTMGNTMQSVVSVAPSTAADHAANRHFVHATPQPALPASMSERIGALTISGKGPAVIRTIHQQRRIADRAMMGTGSEWRTFRAGSPEPSAAALAARSAASIGVRGKDPTMAHFLDAGRYNTAYVKPVDVLDAERKMAEEKARLKKLIETSESAVARAEHKKRLQELQNFRLFAPRKTPQQQMMQQQQQAAPKDGGAAAGGKSEASSAGIGVKRQSSLKRLLSSVRIGDFDLTQQVSDMSLVGDAFHPTYSCYGCRAPYLFMMGDDKIVEYMRKCTLVAYDVTDNVYVLQWDTTDEPEEYKERMAQRERASAALGLPVAQRNKEPLPLKRLSPLVIRFGGESESAFTARKELAYELRSREEALIRLQSYADMALAAEGSVEPLSEEAIERMLRKATNNEAIPEQHIVLAMDLMKEIEQSHDRALRSAVVEYQLKAPEMQERLRDLRLPHKADLIINPKPHTPGNFSLAHPSPLVSVSERIIEFEIARRWALREAFVLRPELYSGFFFSNRHWIKFEEQWLVDTEFENFPLPARLIDYASRQVSYTGEARRQLQHEWLGVVVTHLRGELVNTFDLYMDNVETYIRSRCARYFKALNLSLGTRLQGLVYQTIERFRAWISGLDLPEDMADAIADVRSGAETPLHHAPFRALVGCTLHIEVIEISYRQAEEKRRLVAEKKRKEDEARRRSMRRKSTIRLEQQAVRQERRQSQVFSASTMDAPLLDDTSPNHRYSDDSDKDGESDEENLGGFAAQEGEDLSGPRSPARKRRPKIGRSLAGVVPVVITTLVMDPATGILGFSPSLREVEQTFRVVFESIFLSTDDIVGVGSSFFEMLSLEDEPLTKHSQQLRGQDTAVLSCSALLDTVWAANEAIPAGVLALYKPLETAILTRTPEEITRAFMNAGKPQEEIDAAAAAANSKDKKKNNSNSSNKNEDDEDKMGDEFDLDDVPSSPTKRGLLGTQVGSGASGASGSGADGKNKQEEEKKHRAPPDLPTVGVRLESDPTLADFRTICDRLFEYQRIVRGRSLGEVNTPILKVETFNAKEAMITHIMKVIGCLLDQLIAWVTKDVEVSADQYAKIHEYIQLEPRSPEELKYLREFVDKLPAKMNELEGFYEDIAVRIQLLSEYGFLPPNHVFEKYWSGYSWPRKIGVVLDDMPFQMLSFRAQFIMQLTDGMKSLEDEIKDLQRNVQLFDYEDQEAQVERNLKRVIDTEASLASVRQRAKLYNSHEQIFGSIPTRHTVLQEVEVQFMPHSALWKLTAQMQDISKWNDLPLEKMDAESVFVTVTGWGREIARLGKIMGMNPPAAVVKSLKEKLDAFKPCIPVLMALARQSVLRGRRHQGRLCDELKIEKAGFELKEKSITELIGLGALHHIAAIDQLSENAEHEYRMELQLSKMQDEWKLTKFVLQKTDTIILLRETDPLRLMLDEHTTKTASMMASPYAASIIDQVRAWEQRVSRTSKMLDAWLICQQGYNYLYPIFFGSDIALSMPEEARVFIGISEMWNTLMESASKNPNVMSRCNDDKLQGQLTDANTKLDKIQRELVKFLDKKRAAFPRFFFLSNEDLIQILSETQQARLVRPHLKKLWEGMVDVTFEDKAGWVPPPPTAAAAAGHEGGGGAADYEGKKAPLPPVLITQMIASTKEKVALVEAVDPEAFDNMVERWLSQLDRSMQLTLRDLFSKAMEDFPRHKSRNDFIPCWPGQVSTVVSCIKWTQMMEDCINGRSLADAAKKTKIWLDELVFMVRGKLSSSLVATVQAMIVLEVHNRDCADELFDKDTANLSDFGWMSQLRYYWKPEDRTCDVEQTFAKLKYGNEYLGNTPRLVITPLTDRCFRTLTSAVSMYYGGAPEGPAGTGKTETTKDLAKAIGKACIAAGTLVTLEDGSTKAIETIVPGDRVLAWNRDRSIGDSCLGGYNGTRVTHVHDQGVKKCVELAFSDGRTVTCTPDHRFLLSDGKWCRADQLPLLRNDDSNNSKKNLALGILARPIDTKRAHVADACSRWELKVAAAAGFAPFNIKTETDLERTSAFVRVVGLLSSSAGSIGVQRCVAQLSSGKDKDLFIRDCEALEKGCTSQSLRIVVADEGADESVLRWVVKIGGKLGAAIRGLDGLCSGKKLPAFITDAKCPLAVLQEFQAGMFSGDSAQPGRTTQSQAFLLERRATGTHHVYDLSVEYGNTKDPNFLVNGVVAHNCVVMNCSDQIKSAEMEKLLRGIASSGCWGCFDEFNRIELQVLSVIAQQVLTIQLAVAQKRQEFMFEGKLCALKDGASVFVTMNPGYAGRAELPDNLKALFRTCFAAGTAVLMADYSTKPIEEVKAGDRVMTWDRDQQNNNKNNTLLGGMVPTTVKALLNQGEKPVVELTFFDGRSVVCTNDHRFLLADGTWCRADEIPVVAQTATTTFNDNSKSVMMGVRGTAQRSFTDSEMKWTLPLADLQCNTPAAQERTLAFARIAGYIMTATNNKKECVAVLGSELDAQQLVSDCRRYFGDDSMCGFEMQKNNKSFSVKIRNELQLAFSGMQKQQKDSTLLPDFVLDRQCPVPVVAQFLAGFFGANCTSPTLTKSGFSAPSISQSGCCAKMLRNKMQRIQALLARCGVTEFDTVTEESKLLTRAGCCNYKSHFTITLKASPQQQQEKNNFYDNIGIAYSAEKQHRFAVVNAWQQTQATVSPKEFLERIGATHIFNNSKKNTVSAASQPLRNQLLGRRELSGIRTVYDLSVEHHSNGADNSFLVNGMVAHNCAMMVPDYSLIAEISLYSCGFYDARSLASKIVATYKLASEQLSSQSHYDYGMRAVKSVLNAAAEFRQRSPDENESVLVLRSIADVNVPKFLTNDATLFRWILGDLFRGVVLPDLKMEALETGMEIESRNHNLMYSDFFQLKMKQIWGTMGVRHGVMVVGGAVSGKNSCLDVLAAGLTWARKNRHVHEETLLHRMNPKAMTSDHMYGMSDAAGTEWFDGVLSRHFRDSANDSSTERRHWLVLDGPVDAMWIENMNTVLDDNKKLCLANGDVIRMTEYMTMVFVAQDLAAASPATVSRCGMIYLEPAQLGWQPLFHAWINGKMPAIFSGEDARPEPKTIFTRLIEKCMEPIRNFIGRDAVLGCPLSPQVLSYRFFEFLSVVLHDIFEGVTVEQVNAATEQDLTIYLEGAFVFAVVWTFGGSIRDSGRKAFDKWLRIGWTGKGSKDNPASVPPFSCPLAVSLPNEQDRSLFDVAWIVPKSMEGEATWMDWMSTLDLGKKKDGDKKKKKDGHADAEGGADGAGGEGGAEGSEGGGGGGAARKGSIVKDLSDLNVLEMIVPTPQTTCTIYLSRQLMQQGVPVLLNGATGSGKSMLLKRCAAEHLDPRHYLNMTLPMSANTTTAQMQKAVMSRLERRGVGRYMPPIDHKMLLIVDDLGMPEPDEYGTQRPIELLRQLLSGGGWHAIGSKTGAFHTLGDLLFAAAMQPADSGRAMVTQRLLRRYHNIYMPPQDTVAMKLILSTIMDKMLTAPGMQSGLRGMRDNIISYLVGLYNSISEGFLPTPSQPHYTFNIRDILRTMQGLTACRGPSIRDETGFVTAVTHECLRSFGDRLVSEADQAQLKKIVQNHLSKTLRVNYELVVPCEPLVYASFIPTATEVESGSMRDFKEEQKKAMKDAGLSSAAEKILTVVESEAERIYKPVLNFAAANSETNALVALANSDSTFARHGRLQVIAFDYVVQHVARIVRIIQQPRGAALLVGPGGSGRRSNARLAAFIARHEVKQIAPTKKYTRENWSDDFTAILRQTGERDNPTTFLLPENHIVDEYILEDVNCFLNVGEVPGLFNQDTQEQIFGAMAKLASIAGIEPTQDACLSLFWQRCRNNLHMIVTLSPVGGQFRNYVRKFPSIIACMTCDWFLKWPLDGLLAVGHSIVAKSGSWSEPEAKFIVETGVNMYETASKQFAMAKQLKLPVKLDLTPSVFLDLLDTFEHFKKTKTAEYITARDRYINGVSVLIKTQKLVADLQQQLEDAAPALEKAARDTEELVKVVDADATEVEKERKLIAQDEAVATEKANAAAAVKKECEAELAVAMPAMQAAQAAVSNIDKKQLIELRSLNQPPDKARPVFEAICIILKQRPREIKGEMGKKDYDYWHPMKTKVMADIEAFKQQLLDYDKENMDPEIFEKIIRPQYVENKQFRPEIVKDVSQALVGLCQWVLAMETYYRTYKIVKPKMIKLKQAEDDYAKEAAALAEKVAKLQAITDRLNGLKQKLSDAITEKRRLEYEQKQTQQKLARAERLLNGLSSEKDRYRESAEGFAKKLTTVNGDALAAAGIVVMLGALPQSSRTALKDKWLERMSKSLLPCTMPFDLEAFLGDAAHTLQWRICGLPSDAFSIDNALIFHNTRRTPMLIDPHDQAGAWIKVMERSKEGGVGGFTAVRASDKNLAAVIGKAVQEGHHVLVEGMGEAIDSLLMPVALRAYSIYDGKKIINVGEHTLTLHDNFRLTLSTRIATPTFMTDSSSAVCLIGFFVTKDGLQEQLLQKVLQHEEREQDEKRSRFIESGAKSKLQLRGIEDNILGMISTRTDLLESDDVITQLESGKKTAHQLEQRLTEIEGFQRAFDKIRLRYVPLAAAGAQIYTSVTSLVFVERTYHFSLMWFLRLFMLSMAQPESGDEDAAGGSYAAASFAGGFGGGGAGAGNADEGEVALRKLMLSFTDHAAQIPPLVVMRVNECFDKLLDIIHRDVTRATFSKDHVVAEMLITTGLDMHTPHQHDEFNYFVRGRSAAVGDAVEASRHPASKPDFLTDDVWKGVCHLTEDVGHAAFRSFSRDVFADEHKQFSGFIEACAKVTAGETASGAPFPQLPDKYDVPNVTPFQRLLAVSVLYPPLIVAASKEFLITVRGEEVLVPAPVDINAIIQQNPDPTTVILFVLSSGVDPQQQWRAAAAEHGMDERCDTLSLGMGMDARAQDLIDNAKSMGRWVLLQNLHLYKDWLPTLDRVLQELALLGADTGSAGGAGGVSGSPTIAKPRGLNGKFRLWLTAANSENVLPSIWFRSFKTVLEPPQGLRSGIQRALLSPMLADPAQFNAVPPDRAPLWRRICFALCSFDAVLHERKRFGPVGWNIPYGFSEADLSTSLNQVQRLVSDNRYKGELPLEAVSYLIGECFYGGRVTDVHDRYVLQAILATFLRSATEEVGEGTAGVAMPVELEPVPPPTDAEKSPGWKLLWKHAQQRSSDDPSPEACGLHISANLTRLYRDAAMLKGSISDALPPAVAPAASKKSDADEQQQQSKDKKAAATAAAGSAAPSSPGLETAQKREVTAIETMCVEILKNLHPCFDVETVEAERPMTYDDVMNTVLLLELGRFNRLLDKMHKSLKGLVRALRGESVMSAELDSIREDIERGRLPNAWRKVCYPSLRAFASFMTDLQERLVMLDTWIKEGPPVVVWLGGLHFPQPFVTGTMQNFSREVGVEIDRIEWEFTVVHGQPTEPAAQGCFVGGLYLEAGGWSFENTRCGLSDPSVTELKVPFPILKLTPVVPPVKKAPKSSLVEDASNVDDDDALGGGGSGTKSENSGMMNANDASEEEDEDDDNVQTNVPFVAYEHAENAAAAGPWKRVPRHVAHPALFYHCPLYRTYERRGVLSTTGHSTNFVFRVALPLANNMTAKVIGAEYFVRRGTALFTSAE